MSKSLHRLSRAIQSCVITWASLQAFIEVFADTISTPDALNPGIAAVTSHRGEIQHHNQEGKHQKVQTRSILTIDQTFFGTEEQGALFLSLSNGVGLGLGESTHIWIDRYQQQMINPKNESLSFEASISKLQARIEVGTLVVAFNHLSPLSQAEFKLPLGRVRIYSGRIFLEVKSDTSCKISAYQGTATFYFEDTEERAFISAGTGIEITTESAKNLKIDSSISIEPNPEDWPLLVKATDYSRQRVAYRFNPDGHQPMQIWILPDEQFGEPSPRPYEFDLK